MALPAGSAVCHGTDAASAFGQPPALEHETGNGQKQHRAMRLVSDVEEP